jgi:DNA-binding CsgD family transcriptional regulator
LLGEAQQPLLRRMAVFQGCTLDAVQAVCCEASPRTGASATTVAPLDIDAIDGIADLVNNSMLQQARTAGSTPWYVMLETIQEYALERLEHSGEGAPLRRRHAMYYLTLAESAGLELVGPHQADWFARLELEQDNLRAALHWCGAQGYAEVALRLAAALWWFWAVRGYGNEGRERLAALLERFKSPSPSARLTAARARALHAAGNLASFQGDLRSARAFNQQALDLFRTQSDAAGVESVLHALALVASREADHPTAIDLLEQVLESARARRDQRAIGVALYNLGTVLHQQGELAAAREALTECVELKRRIGGPRDIGLALLTLAAVVETQGERTVAISLYEESIGACRSSGDDRAAALGLLGLAKIEEDHRDYAAAQRYVGESLSLHQRLGDMQGLALVLERAASIASGLNHHRRAVRLQGAVVGLRERIGNTQPPPSRAKADLWRRRATRALGSIGVQTAWEAGRAMSASEAVKCALDLAEPDISETPPTKLRIFAAEKLTPREREVATWVALGYTNRELAVKLVITEGTAASHVNHILDKLSFSSRSQIAAWATERGLLAAKLSSTRENEGGTANAAIH